MMKPTCFCKPRVDDCPKCSKPDYSKIKPSSGVSNAKLFKARLELKSVAA